MNNINLKVYKNPESGEFVNEYKPLRNLIDTTSDTEKNNIVNFDVNLNSNLTKPLDIDCQDSYDGTVNLILNDDYNAPRIINTRFSKLEDNQYKIINRNQLEQTNLYKDTEVDKQTRLFRNINNIPKIDLLDIGNSGKLKGGNYTFYIKFADNDYNKTDIVAESGQVSIFKGDLSKISSISGTILNEETDKYVTLKISNIDKSFSKIYVYYIRNYCDENGIRQTEAALIQEPYDIKNIEETITITGYETTEEISVEEVNIQYNMAAAVKTQTQVQNMLFFGNIQKPEVKIKELQNLSYYIKVSLQQSDKTVGYIDEEYKPDEKGDPYNTEYYSPYNIYYKLGYWPDEIYRLGVVYIMNDDSLSPVFNLRGCVFNNIGDSNFYNESAFVNGEMQYLERDAFLTSENLSNTFGVFKNADTHIIQENSVYPIYYEISLNADIKNSLQSFGVKGLFFVRQKRIPTTICQGISVGVDKNSYIPMPYVETNNNLSFYTAETFLNTNRKLIEQGAYPNLVYTNSIKYSGILSLDSCVIPTVQDLFDNSNFVLKGSHTHDCKIHQRHIYGDISTSKNINTVSSKLLYINSDIELRSIDSRNYSTKCGNAADISQFSFFEKNDYSKNNYKLLRGLYCSYLASDQMLPPNTVYNIKTSNYNESSMKDYFIIRKNDTTQFYAISDRYELTNIPETIDVYRGDCYSCTVTMRINRNFTDSEVPMSTNIIDNNTWRDHYKGYNNTSKTEYESINRGDVNAVQLGLWITYKCLSSYNLGLRSVDDSHFDEIAIHGNPRSFYPNTSLDISPSNKIEESRLLNQGYSATVGEKRYYVAPNVPYIKDIFDTRVMFSNVQREDSFQNAYRIFQGLDFKDIDRTYGAIVKFIPWDVNILCIFEHGIGIIPINEKALIQTATNQSIHMYGAGVLQNQITLISDSFGSIWEESIVKTPKGVYGVDTFAKKIWRVSTNGFETISDVSIQQFLNDNIKLREKDNYPIIGLRNVKAHYNNYKGDIMFTFYNGWYDTNYKSKPYKELAWNLCYNERMDAWVTKYTWTPLYSENINNMFYSLDQNRSKILSYVYKNINSKTGISTEQNEFEITDNNADSAISIPIVLHNTAHVDDFEVVVKSMESSYVDNGVEHIVVKDSKNQEDVDILQSLFSFDDTTKCLEISSYNDLKSVIGSIPTYLKIIVSVQVPISNNSEKYILFEEIIGIVFDVKVTADKDEYDEQSSYLLQNAVYVHGRAGIFDEIDYEDESFENQILPTKWYDRQEKFEFEFVVNDPVGAHKIFDNLLIISNNVQPDELQFEIIGDAYNFNKTGIYRHEHFGDGIWDTEYNKPKFLIPQKERTRKYPISYQTNQQFKNCDVVWDTTLNQYSLVVKQKCKNIEEFGRRLGNIQYLEDSWSIVIDPIIYKEQYKIGDTADIEERTSDYKAVRLRDKFIKIRIIYSGKDLAVITALNTIITESYA